MTAGRIVMSITHVEANEAALTQPFSRPGADAAALDTFANVLANDVLVDDDGGTTVATRNAAALIFKLE